MAQTAFELLLDIDQRCRQLAAQLPSQENHLQTWSGIGFRLGSHWYVAPMGEVAEVLHEPRLSRVPGVKPWLLGVANVRGRLLPVLDLSGLLGHEPLAVHKHRRVLVIDRDEWIAGLLVDEVGGLQHFPLHSLDLSVAGDLPAGMAAFVQGHFQRDQLWHVFSPFALAHLPGFMNVAL
ncbi:chemotaxis protein CheW [Pseudomonas sp. App30]|uniref:chemotaxis protein CheW n=1 Tax=Pseudomonas sp. App30 TaxID=3068990 RepID=UPI003A8007F3